MHKKPLNISIIKPTLKKKVLYRQSQLFLTLGFSEVVYRDANKLYLCLKWIRQSEPCFIIPFVLLSGVAQAQGVHEILNGNLFTVSSVDHVIDYNALDPT